MAYVSQERYKDMEYVRLFFSSSFINMSSANRFAALLGDENTEVDKLGNVKPAEKKESDHPPTRREQRRTNQKRVPAGNKRSQTPSFLLILS